MPREPLLLMLGLLADAAWIAVGLSLVGWTFGQAGALLPFVTVFAVLAVGYAIGFLAPHDPAAEQRRRPGIVWSTLQSVIGAVVAAAAVQSSVALAGVDGFWLFAVAAGRISSTAGVGLVLALLACLVVWRHAVSVALNSPADRLRSVFFWGALCMVVAALGDSVCGCGLLSPAPLALFFASALAGLVLTQLPADDGRPLFWLRMLSAVVSLILGAGLLVAELSAAYGERVASTTGEFWRAAAQAMVDLVATVIGPLVVWLVTALEWLVNEVGSGGADFRFPNLLAIRSLGSSGPINGWDSGWLNALVVAAIVLLSVVVLTRAFGRRSRLLERSAFDDVVAVDVDEHGGLWHLLMELIPWRRGRSADATVAWLAGSAPLRQEFALYFAMLDRATDRGWRFRSSDTPLERLADLQHVLPIAPAAEITSCFNLACYGERNSDRRRLAELAERLDAAARPPS